MNNKKNSENVKAIETIANISTEGKKESQLIAFRADFDSSKRIEALEKLLNKPKTDIIKEAIRCSFDGLLIKDTFERLFPIIQKIFEEVKVLHGGFGSHKEEVDDSLPIDLEVDEGSLFIELSKIKSKYKDEEITESLHLLILELKVEGLKTIKLDIRKPVMIVDVSKIDAESLKELQLIALNNNLELKSSKLVENEMKFELRIERRIDLHENWMDNFEKDMGAVNKALKQLMKLSCFSDKKKKKSQSK